MRATAGEAAALETAAEGAGLAVMTLGTASIAAGVAVTGLLGLLAFSARKELEEFGNAAAYGGQKLSEGIAKAVGDFTGFPQDVKAATNALKELTGQAAEERGEEAKLLNAKLDTALARQKARMAAEAERAAIDEVARAIGRETIEIDNRRRALDRANAVQEEEAKTKEAATRARFAKERAELENVTGISETERAQRQASIDRREFNELQTGAKDRIQNQIAAETEKERAAYDAVKGAREEVESIRGKFKGLELNGLGPGSAEYKNLEKQLADAQKFADEMQKKAERQSDQSSDRKVRLQGELKRLEVVGGYESATLEEKSKGNLSKATQKDNEERSQNAEKERMEALRLLKDQVLGGMGNLRGRFDQQPGVEGSKEVLSMVEGVERTARALESGGATPVEMQAFQQAMGRLTAALAKISPSLTRGMRAFREELEPRLTQIEAEIASLNSASTK